MSLAGKSGTTNDVRDSWFIGYSPYLTCGIWGGNDDNSAQESGDYVKAIWKSVMSRAHESYANADFASTGQLVKCIICTKCGKIAVTGLCDVTEQGDMTAVEYYAEGTEPTEECDCHVAVEVCTSSGEKAGSYCPNSKRHVYLRSATEGTEDAAYVIPDSMKGSHSCSEHTSMWSEWWNNHNGSNGGNSHGNDSGSGHGGNSGSNGNSGGSWWSDFWTGGSDDSGNGSSGGSSGGSGNGGYDGNTGSGRDDNGNSDGYGSGREDSGGSNDNSGQDWWDWLFGA
jgi:penicillin-binding protein 1A